MAKEYLYLLLSVFIFLNGVEYFEHNIEKVVKKQETIKYKLKKQALYKSNKKEVEKLIGEQKKLFIKNRELFFNKEIKETIVFSELQQNIQSVIKKIGGKPIHLNSGMVIDKKFYRKYPLALTLEVIPEDLENFFQELHHNKKYLFIDSIHISKNHKKQLLRLKITLIGYQLK